MTPLEHRIVKLLRDGYRAGDVACLLNIHYDCITRAVEKDRLRILISRESYKPIATTTLAKARNCHSTLPPVEF